MHRLVVTALSAGCAFAAQVWWMPKLELKSIAQIPARLDKPFEDAISVAKNDAKAKVSNCRDYLKYSSLGYQPASDQEFRVLKSWGVDCMALQALSEAAPARESFVEDLQLDPRFLSPRLAPGISREASRKARRAESLGLSWRQYEPGLKLQRGPEGEAIVSGAGMRTTIAIYARGDFNEDGIEDVLLRTDTSAERGTYADSRLFLATRGSKTGKLKVLKEYK